MLTLLMKRCRIESTAMKELYIQIRESSIRLKKPLKLRKNVLKQKPNLEKSEINNGRKKKTVILLVKKKLQK